MKRVEQFKCDYCCTLYKDKSECVKCENQHVTAVEIVAQHHLPAKVSAKYPPRINVKMSDGTVSVYERRSG